MEIFVNSIILYFYYFIMYIIVYKSWQAEHRVARLAFFEAKYNIFGLFLTVRRLSQKVAKSNLFNGWPFIKV